MTSSRISRGLSWPPFGFGFFFPQVFFTAPTVEGRLRNERDQLFDRLHGVALS